MFLFEAHVRRGLGSGRFQGGFEEDSRRVQVADWEVAFCFGDALRLVVVVGCRGCGNEKPCVSKMLQILQSKNVFV